MKNLNKKKLAKRLFKSNTKEFPLLNLYILVFIVLECVVELFQFSMILTILKPFVLMMMIYYIHNKTTNLDYLVCNITKLGLVFALIGQFIQLSDQNQADIFSLIFFALSHVAYFACFNIKEKIGLVTLKRKLLLLLICLIYAIMIIGFLKFTWNSLNNRNTMIVYYLIVGVMIFAAILRYHNTSPRSYLFGIIGCSLLLASNMLSTSIELGRSNLITSSNWWQFGNMLAFYCGHYLLMHGSILHSTLQDTIERLSAKSY